VEKRGPFCQRAQPFRCRSLPIVRSPLKNGLFLLAGLFPGFFVGKNRRQKSTRLSRSSIFTSRDLHVQRSSRPEIFTSRKTKPRVPGDLRAYVAASGAQIERQRGPHSPALAPALAGQIPGTALSALVHVPSPSPLEPGVTVRGRSRRGTW